MGTRSTRPRSSSGSHPAFLHTPLPSASHARSVEGRKTPTALLRPARRPARPAPAGSATAPRRATRPTGYRTRRSHRHAARALDVGGRLLVARDRLADLADIRLRRLVQLGGVDLGAEQVGEPAAQGGGRLRTRRERDVVRHGGPEARGRDVRALASVMDDARRCRSDPRNAMPGARAAR
jgi:hypothetical protein